MVKLKNLIAIAGLSLGSILASCRDRSNDFTYYGKFEGHDAVAAFDGVRSVTIRDGDNYINARDFNARDVYTERFDRISILLPKGHELEKYANLEKLEEAYDKLRAEHLSKAK